jgi:hypothetical protein
LTGHLADLAGAYRFAFRSNHLWLSSQEEGDIAISGKVELAEINGSETFIYVHHGKSAFVVQQEGVHPFSMGSEISVFINPEAPFCIRYVRPAGGRARSKQEQRPDDCRGIANRICLPSASDSLESIARRTHGAYRIRPDRPLILPEPGNASDYALKEINTLFGRTAGPTPCWDLPAAARPRCST